MKEMTNDSIQVTRDTTDFCGGFATYMMIPRLHRSHFLSYDHARSCQTSTTSGAINSADPTFNVTHPMINKTSLHYPVQDDLIQNPQI